MSTLLERIRQLDGPQSRGNVRGSVLENVRRLCSARLGSVPACPGYGLPDAVHYAATSPDLIAATPRALRDALVAYEPRLTNVTVSQVPVDGALQFEITARLVTRAGARNGASVVFRTRLGTGAVTVEG